MEQFGLRFGFDGEKNSNGEFWKGFGWPCMHGSHSRGEGVLSSKLLFLPVDNR